MIKNPKADFFFDKPGKWQEAYIALRRIVLHRGLTEELKWGQPCYTLGGKNVVLIHGFKEYCALLFMKGALLKDDRNILIRQTENVQSARQIRFTDVSEVTAQEPMLEAYIREAAEVERSGQKVGLKKTGDYPVPEELRKKLEENKALKEAFGALTPGRQRAYLFHFSSAKQAGTREARIDKVIPMIMAGKGLHD